jgi:hypothetical protein
MAQFSQIASDGILMWYRAPTWPKHSSGVAERGSLQLDRTPHSIAAKLAATFGLPHAGTFRALGAAAGSSASTSTRSVATILLHDFTVGPEHEASELALRGNMLVSVFSLVEMSWPISTAVGSGLDYLAASIHQTVRTRVVRLNFPFFECMICYCQEVISPRHFFAGMSEDLSMKLTV